MYRFFSLLILFIALFSTSCKQEPTLEKFIITNIDKPHISSFDISGSLLSLNNESQSPENQKVMQTIKKANIIGHTIKTSDDVTYLIELEELRKLLTNQKYEEYMRFGKGSSGLRMYAVEDKKGISEFVVLGNDHQKGWLLIRVLGEQMEPEKILEAIKELDMEQLPIDQLKDLF